MGEWNGNGMGDLGNWKMGEWKILFWWKIKWRLVLLGALGIMGDPFKYFFFQINGVDVLATTTVEQAVQLINSSKRKVVLLVQKRALQTIVVSVFPVATLLLCFSDQIKRTNKQTNKIRGV